MFVTLHEQARPIYLRRRRILAVEAWNTGAKITFDLYKGDGLTTAVVDETIEEVHKAMKWWRCLLFRRG